MKLFDASFLITSQTITREQYNALGKAISEHNIIYVKHIEGGYMIAIAAEESHGLLFIELYYMDNFLNLIINGDTLSIRPEQDGFARISDVQNMEERLMELINAKG